MKKNEEKKLYTYLLIILTKLRELCTSCGSRIFLRGRPISKVGVLTYYLQNFCRKLHENETNWTLKGRASQAPLGSANALDRIFNLVTRSFFVHDPLFLCNIEVFFEKITPVIFRNCFFFYFWVILFQVT